MIETAPKTSPNKTPADFRRRIPKMRRECRFTMRVLIGDQVRGEGAGRSKRAAQVAAARQALDTEPASDA